MADPLRRLGVTLLALAAAAPLAAQQVRVRSTTTGQYIQLRALTTDTTGAYVAGAVNEAVPLSEDIEVSSWGFGLQGLRAYGLFRVRGSIGSSLVWPRYDDHFDAMAAYLELERTEWRFRLGRQQRASGLGLYGFDGGAVTWRPKPNLRFETYGGRGLARGYNDPINSSAILTEDPFIPDQGTLLFGVSGWVAPTERSYFSAIYQREILNDFTGIVSERMALDGQTTINRRWTLAASTDVDIASSAWGKARLGLTAWLPHSSSVAIALFRYRPTFDLTTIWGAFAPQPHSGVSAAATLPPFGAFSFTAGWTLRVYEKVTETTPFLVDVGTTTNTLSLGGTWTHQAATVTGNYRFITGYGGEESAGDVRVGFDRGERWKFGFNGTVFQNTEYFRVARGTVVGIGADARADVSSRLSLSGHLTQFFHTGTTGMDSPNWNQTRALFQVDWVMGANADRVAGYR